MLCLLYEGGTTEGDGQGEARVEVTNRLRTVLARQVVSFEVKRGEAVGTIKVIHE